MGLPLKLRGWQCMILKNLATWAVFRTRYTRIFSRNPFYQTKKLSVSHTRVPGSNRYLGTVGLPWKLRRFQLIIPCIRSHPLDRISYPLRFQLFIRSKHDRLALSRVPEDSAVRRVGTRVLGC